MIQAYLILLLDTTRSSVLLLSNMLWKLYRLLAEKGPAPPPPLGNFADIVYLKEQSFLIQMRDVCTLYAGA